MKTHPNLGKLERGSDLVGIFKVTFLKYNNQKFHGSASRTPSEVSTAVYLRQLIIRNSELLNKSPKARVEISRMLRENGFVKHLERAKTIESMAGKFQLEK